MILLLSKIFNINDFPLILQEYPYAFPMMLVYSLWIGFAGGIVLYVGAMTRISEGIEDAAKVDGAGTMTEFWHIIMPSVYPMLTVFLVTGFVNLFIGGGPIYTFFEDRAPDYTYTMGYFLLVRVIGSNS